MHWTNGQLPFDVIIIVLLFTSNRFCLQSLQSFNVDFKHVFLFFFLLPYRKQSAVMVSKSWKLALKFSKLTTHLMLPSIYTYEQYLSRHIFDAKACEASLRGIFSLGVLILLQNLQPLKSIIKYVEKKFVYVKGFRNTYNSHCCILA